MKLVNIPIELLQKNSSQARKYFNKEKLEELALSIKSQGLIEPLIVRQCSIDKNYEIIAGERRWRASMLAGLDTLACIVTTYDDEKADVVSLVENIQREDLNSLEEAQGIYKLQQRFNFTQEETAILLGKSRSYIANLLRLLTLSPKVQKLLQETKITTAHARLLVVLDEKQQNLLAECVVRYNWSVRELEKKIANLKPQKLTKREKDKDVHYFEKNLSSILCTEVEIEQNTKGGWLKIKFYDNDTLEGILEKMGLLQTFVEE